MILANDRITRFEQFAHSIPEPHYLSQFSVPLTTVLAGAGAGAGAGLIAGIHDGSLIQDLGLAILIATMIPFGRFQLDVAAGLPRARSLAHASAGSSATPTGDWPHR
jgi:hypothetical protein